jgi:hypothetical protein
MEVIGGKKRSKGQKRRWKGYEVIRTLIKELQEYNSEMEENSSL